jgi:conjugal transfer pilus assembly protein TraF
MRKACLVFTLGLFTSNLQAHWIDRKAEGWAFYEDIEKPKIEKPIEPSIQVVAPLKTAKEELDEQKQLVEEKLAQAILYPTTENLLDYMAIQQKVVNQGSLFANTWVKALLNHPELDARLQEFPTSQYGIQVQKQVVQKKKEQLIQALTQNYGLFFFYEGDNPVSQAFALVVQAFQAKYGWEVLAISKDHVIIPEFANNQIDNGTIKNLGVTYFPSLYLVDPLRQNVIPIGFGLASMDQLETNLFMQMSPEGTPQ